MIRLSFALPTTRWSATWEPEIDQIDCLAVLVDKYDCSPTMRNYGEVLIYRVIDIITTMEELWALLHFTHGLAISDSVSSAYTIANKQANMFTRSLSMVSPLHTHVLIFNSASRNPDDGFMIHGLVHAMGAATNMNQITPQGESRTLKTCQRLGHLTVSPYHPFKARSS